MQPDRLIKFAPPAIGDDEIDAVVDALRSGWLTTGPRVKELESRLAEHLAVPAALALNSGTAAMHLALVALGIGPGDIVITSTMTFCSTVHVIEHVGATPLLVDVEADTLNLDPDAVAAAMAAPSAGPSGRVAALLPVHYAGHPYDRAILAAAEAAGIAVVEDAAHAMGSRWAEEPVGSINATVNRMVAFSFYATKNLATGEGGALVGPERLVAEARAWSLHGMSQDTWKRYAEFGRWYYEVDRPGFKYNMADPNAAMGLVQLRRLEEIKARRHHIAARYLDGLVDTPLELPVERDGVHHSWHLFPIRVPTELRDERDDLIRTLGDNGIGTSVHFVPIHRHPYYRDRYELSREAFPVADDAFERLVSLPIHAGLGDDDVDYVIDAIQRWCDAH